jgi:hypothetical protein
MSTSTSSSSILATMPPISSIVTIHLTTENHLIWKAQLLAFLHTHQLLGIING